MHRIHPWIIPLLIITLFSCPKKKDQEQPSAQEPTFSTVGDSLSDSTQAIQKWALLVGINDYKSSLISDLAGCVNDVQNMKTLLTTRFEFPESHVMMLTDQEATHEKIVSTFQEHLVARAGLNDIVVFHYSGHGSQMIDVSSDEADGYDETIVPHDSRQGDVYDISDDELNGLLRLLKSKNITVIFDACHSGTALRASGRRRSAPADLRQPRPIVGYAVSERGVSQGENDVRLINANYVLLSACTSRQSAFEHFAEGRENGAFSYFLANELRKAGAGVTYRDIMDRVKGSVQANYFNQNPQLEGTGLNQFVFSDSVAVNQSYYLASPVSGNRVEISAGAVQGLTEGSTFDVFPPDTKDFHDANQAIARIEVKRTGSFKSEAEIIRGNPIPAFSRAVLREFNYKDRKLLIHFKNLSASPTLSSIKNELSGYAFIESITEPYGYHLLLREDDRKIVTEWADTTVIATPISIDAPDVVQQLVEQINQWAKWFNIFSIANVQPVLMVDLRIEAIRGESTRDPFARIETLDAVIYEGEDFECTIENKSTRDVFISLLDLSTDGSVTVIYPYPEGAGELLRAGQSITKRFESFLPEGKESVMDVIKVFATSTPIDFYTLTQPAIRGGLRGEMPNVLKDPLGRLLAQGALGFTRGAKPKAVDLGNWSTQQRVFKVKRQGN